MALEPWSERGTQISDNATVFPKRGAVVEMPQRRTNWRWFKWIAGLTVFLLFPSVIGGEEKEPAGQRVLDHRSLGPRSNPTADARSDLSEERRREIFKDVWRAALHAEREAEKRFPERYTKEVSREQFIAHGNFLKQLDDANEEAIAKRFGITREQVKAIKVEGDKKKWPLPNVER